MALALLPFIVTAATVLIAALVSSPQLRSGLPLPLTQQGDRHQKRR